MADICSNTVFQSSSVIVLPDCWDRTAGSSFSTGAWVWDDVLGVSNRLSKKLLVRLSRGRFSSGSIKVGSGESVGNFDTSEASESGCRVISSEAGTVFVRNLVAE